jgi:hypothetical protein
MPKKEKKNKLNLEVIKFAFLLYYFSNLELSFSDEKPVAKEPAS